MPTVDSHQVILRRLIAGANAVFPSALRDRAFEAPNGMLAFPLDDVEEAIRALESAKAAIMAGALWADDGRGGGAQVVVAVEGKNRSHIWDCPQQPAERWADFVRRAATTAHQNVSEAVRVSNELGPGYIPYVRLSWITEEQGSQFDLPPLVRHLADEVSEHGDSPWEYLDLARNILGIDVQRGCAVALGSFYARRPIQAVLDAPSHAVFLRVDARSRNFDALLGLEQLEVLEVSRVGPRELAVIGRVSSVRMLSLRDIRATNLGALAGLTQLEHLRCADSATLTSIEALSGLGRLRTLGLGHLRALDYLEEASRLSQLQGLSVTGSMWTHARVSNLAPIVRLRELQSLSLAGVRVADGSLGPLTGLTNLRVLAVSNWFRAEEFAMLAAAFPNLEGEGYRSMWWVPPRPGSGPAYNVCKRCNVQVPGMTIGRPAKQLCPQCDQAKIARFAAKWETMIAAARSSLRHQHDST